jgi:hypothetical protein
VRKMIVNLGQVFVARRHLRRENCFSHKLQPASFAVA